MAMLLVFALILGLFGLRMYSVQFRGGGALVADSDTYTTYYTVKASRGELLDRNGNVMVGNRASYDLVFNNFVLTNSDDPNGHLLRLVKMADELGVEYIENFPITEDRPYEYTLAEQSANWQGYFQDYLWELDIDSDISASRLMEELRELYQIPADWSDADARAVIGLRYEITDSLNHQLTYVGNVKAAVSEKEAPAHEDLVQLIAGEDYYLTVTEGTELVNGTEEPVTSFCVALTASGMAKAAAVEGQIPENMATDRIQRLIALQDECQKKAMARFVGMEEEVLVEGFSKRSKEDMYGRTSQYKTVVFPREGRHIGELVKVEIMEASAATLKGKIAK